MTELDRLLKILSNGAKRLSTSDVTELGIVVSEFIDAGFIENEYVGNPRFKTMDQSNPTDADKLMIIKWMGGQLISIHNGDALFAVNSWINQTTTQCKALGK